MAVPIHQILKSALGVCCGAGLGGFCWKVLEYGAGWALFIGVLGSFIGFALSLPGVSGSRVAGMTAWIFVAYNLSESLGEQTYDAIAGEGEGENPESEPAAASEDIPPRGESHGGMKPDTPTGATRR